MKNKTEQTRSVCYHNDYSPRYRKPYDIYEKAREHMKLQKKKQREQDVTGSDMDS